MTTEDDLRTALLEFADHNEPDHLAVRAEIEARLTGPSRMGQRVDRRPLITLMSVAACVAAVVAVAVGIHVSRSHSTPPGTHLPTPTVGPTVLGMPQYPGTIVLATFSGRGSRVLPIPRHALPKNSQLSVITTCQGSGSFDVANGFSTPGCSDGSAKGSSLSSNARTLQITAAATTTWHAVVVLGPSDQTNSSVVSPSAVAFSTDSPNLGTMSGRGDGTLHLDRSAAAGSYLIYVTCTGDSVTITSSSKLVKNDYTRTCFAGFAYQWSVAKGAAPTDLKISASSSTTWSIVVDAACETACVLPSPNHTK